MVRQYIKIFIALLSISIFLIGCNNQENNKENELIGKIIIYKIDDTKKIEDDNEINIIKLKTNNIIINKTELYNKKIYYEYPNIIKITINQILINQKENLYSDVNIQINPKLEVLYENIKLVENNENKKDIYGELIIKNNNLEDYEKNYLKYYSEKYPERIEYNEKTIKLKFNK
ncbi:hypothetical protein [Gemelliphila palaticanis]|uniref:Lipoprotein n=1 Tax=Gemelliphila palaticanis TaxID=81950 RepID=A0ABX2T0R0_9BACL|nr:hypothetical protein [Gemella palaticanis]MBF0716224.1 hypothetical protein [Gemella palaticanis]NYS48154.1 hypothetical protein [Gemella palaticanis]